MTLLLDNFAVPAVLDQLEALERRIDRHFDRWSGLRGLAEARQAVMLAVQEIGVNIIKHAYGNGSGQIAVLVYAAEEPRRVEIALHDTGRPFDPATVAEPNLDEPQEGGLGLFIVRQLMDDVSYVANGSGNEWRLVKNIGD